MLDVYTHELGDESMEGLLLAYGIDTNHKQERNRQQALVEARTCPHCSEPNKQDAKFFLSCKMVLTYDAHVETINEAEQSKRDMQEMKDKLNSIELKYGKHIEWWDKMASVFSSPEFVEGVKSISSNSYSAAIEKLVGASLIKSAREMKGNKE
jgi:hypothetical protein